MHRVSIVTASVVVSALACLHVAHAQDSPAAPSAAQPQAATPAPVIAPRAEQLLKQMSAYLGSAEHFTFHADATFDHVLPTGQKLQFSAAEDVALQRPDKLYVEWSGDLGDRRFWYDGSSVTLYDPATPFYAAEAAPPDIDGMLEKVAAQLDFAPPLADFLYRDPYKSVRGNIQYGFDLGPSDVGGRRCRSLAFVSKSLYWQIWIDSGPQLTPCKVVITYASRPEQPQFSAVFTDWNFAPRVAAPIFTPTLPAGAQRVPFKTVSSPK